MWGDEQLRRGRAPSSRALHLALLAGLADTVEIATPDAAGYRPLELFGKHPLPPLLRVYLYRMTSPPTERQEGAYRIQITLPGQRRRRGHFDWSDGACVVLAGYEPDLDVFAFWDAALYEDPDGIPFSRNCQVLGSTLYRAMSTEAGVAEQSRRLRGANKDEVVVTACRPQVFAGLLRRIERTWDRLEATGPAAS